MFHSSGEEQEKAVKDSLEMLKTIEEHALGKKRFFCGDKISLVDLAYGWIAQWLEVLEISSPAYMDKKFQGRAHNQGKSARA
jgi:glutathione S-transferase